MCELHVANCTRCGKIAACWQTPCVTVDTEDEYRTCGALMRKTEPAGLCSACLTRGPRTPMSTFPALMRRAKVNGKTMASRCRLKMTLFGRRAQESSERDRRRQSILGRRKHPVSSRGKARGISPHKAVVYHPVADQNTQRPGQVLYRAINPNPSTHRSIIRVRNAKDEKDSGPAKRWPNASGSSSAYSQDLRRTSWPPPRLHDRPLQKALDRRETFFAAMEDLVPCAGALAKCPIGGPGPGRRASMGRARPTSW